jgi:hypothetical protein
MFNNLKITIMKKTIAAMMMMAMTAAMPAMAGNNHFGKNDKKSTVVNHDKKAGHYDKRTAHYDKRTATHFDTRHAARPDMKTYTYRLSRYDSPRAIIERAERINGVKEAKYNPRTRELTILYDAHRTTLHHIKHTMA